ncbi:MAG: hypothetical protein JOZ39_01145 [Chloroflexi bacterium]|nr:hypothetical protein [Chloroflexota bacterium]
MSSIALRATQTSARVSPVLVRPLPAVVAAALGFACAARPALDLDLGWHLRAGQLILATHSIPRTDPFSFSALGRPWVDNEWLWEVVVAWLHGSGGNLAIILINAALSALTAALIYGTLRLRHAAPLFATAGAALAIFGLTLYVDVRPGMAGVLGIAATIYLIERFRSGGSPLWLAGVVPVAALWANLHGSYVNAPALCGVYAAGALFEHRAWRRVVPYLATAAAAITASLANPLGIGLLRFTLEASRLTFNRQHVAAWMPVDFSHELPLLVLLVLSLAIPLLLRHTSVPKTEAFLLVACTVALLQSNEFAPLYAVAAAPVIAQLAGAALAHGSIRWQPSPLLTTAMVGLTILLLATPLRWLNGAVYEKAEASAFPTAAVDLVQRERLTGPMWNDFDWGGYLMTALPDRPVFVDSRTEMYGDAFLADYLNTDQGHEAPDTMLDRYGIRLVLIRPDSPMAVRLAGESSWNQVYTDDMASIFLRVN